MIQIDEIEMYNVDEAAHLLDTTDQAIRRLLRTGKLRGKKVSRRWHVSKQELKRYLQTPDDPDHMTLPDHDREREEVALSESM